MSRKARPFHRRVAALYLFAIYVVAAASETFISPFFPLIRDDLGLVVAQQATLVAVLTFGIGVASLIGGAAGYHRGDRVVIRIAAVAMAVGAAVTGTAHSFVLLVVGQAVAGLGVGLFFAPGMASVGRMFAASRGRAIASYGLGYSVGTAVAAFLAGVEGVGWRWPFYVTAAFCLGLAVIAPPLVDSLDGTPPPMLTSLRSYVRHPFYRMSLVTALVAGSISYIFIGFTPILFVDRGVPLSIVATLIGVGRLASVGTKYIGGWMFDRFGGPESAQRIMFAIPVVGVPLMALPAGGAVIVVAPFVMITSSLLPISHALSVTGLPDRATWGIGVYRAWLVGSPAIVSGAAGLLVHHFGLTSVMYGVLVLPLGCAIAIGVMMRQAAASLASP